MRRLLTLLLSAYCLTIAAPIEALAGSVDAIAPYKVFPKAANVRNIRERMIELNAQLSANPNNTRCLLDLAELEEQKGDLDQAIKHVQSAILHSPNSWQTHASLSRLFLLDRNTLGARLQAERALELTKESRSRKIILTYLISAQIAGNDFAQADKVSKSELKRSPHDAILLFCRAWVLGTKQPTEAISTYRLALQEDPKLTESHYNLALLLTESNRQEALNELKAFIKDPSDASRAKLAEDLMSKLAVQD